MTACILDASVAAKWFLPGASETLAAEAADLLASYSAGRLRLLVPDLFWRIPTARTAPLLSAAFTIAMSTDRTVYDSVYVALAVLSNMPLVTADERLANALAARFPVRWLGAL